MKAEIIENCDVPNMAAAVNQKIQHRELPIALLPESKRTTLNDRRFLVLKAIAAGKSNPEIASALGKSVPVLDRNINRQLFIDLDANGRTSSVRRGYEHDLLQMPACLTC